MKITLPQIDPTLWHRLQLEAMHRGADVSDLLLDALRQFLGLPSLQQSPRKSSGLEQLAGSWTKEDSDAFDRNTADFNEIDLEMWG